MWKSPRRLETIRNLSSFTEVYHVPQLEEYNQHFQLIKHGADETCNGITMFLQNGWWSFCRNITPDQEEFMKRIITWWWRYTWGNQQEIRLYARAAKIFWWWVRIWYDTMYSKLTFVKNEIDIFRWWRSSCYMTEHS